MSVRIIKSSVQMTSTEGCKAGADFLKGECDVMSAALQFAAAAAL